MKHTFKKSFTPLLALLILVVSMVGVTPAYAATRVVTVLDDSGAGSLRDVIAAADPGDVITFDDSLSGQTIHLASTITVDKNLTIDGSSLEEQITISGDTLGDGTGDVRIFIFNATVTDAVLKNLTFTKGMGTTFVQDPIYEVEGGAIFNAGTLTITNSTFSDNTVIYDTGHNEAGGAIANHGTLTVTNTTFSNNHSTLIAGAIYNFINATMTLTNNTFSGNLAVDWGGAIFNRGTLTMTNNTLSGNSAGRAGGGGGLITWDEGTLHYTNNIIANSTAGGDCTNNLGDIGTNVNNLVEDGGCSASFSDDPNLDPVLADNGGPSETFALLPNSAALGAGDNAMCAASNVSNLDQRGRVRPEGDPNCDLGAYESSAGPAAPVITAPVGTISTATPTITGSAEPYSLINITYLDNSTPVQVCTDVPVNGLGEWSCVASTLPDGALQLKINATAGAGDTSADTNHSLTVDTTEPTIVSIQRADPDNTSAASVDFTVTFSEPVTDVLANDFTLHVTGQIIGATIDSVTGSDATYTVTVNTGTKNGTLRLDVPNTATVNDLAGNAMNGLPFETGQVYTVFKTNGADTTGVFRPSNGLLYLKHQNETGFADVEINYGIGGDYPVVGDWDGNGTVTIGVYRNGQFYLRNSNTVGFADIVFPFGSHGDQPVAGDWNGDGVDTIGVYRPSNGQFMLRNSNDAGVPSISFFLGNVGDVGIAGDWNGDGMDTTGVFRPSNGIIFLKNANDTGFADVELNYGIPGDKPVTGDWDNDGIDTIGVYRNGQFYLRNSNTIGFADLVFALGIPGDHPIAGNWDGSIP